YTGKVRILWFLILKGKRNCRFHKIICFLVLAGIIINPAHFSNGLYHKMGRSISFYFIKKFFSLGYRSFFVTVVELKTSLKLNVLITTVVHFFGTIPNNIFLNYRACLGK